MTTSILALRLKDAWHVVVFTGAEESRESSVHD